ncbi:TatD family hydrolase [Acidilobus sp.]|uniref:TatD family hydrolase n=1 Tax=Acidilobus sp. TaxID=1872109 RepID=UPI003D026705
MPLYYDMHCHLSEFTDKEVEELFGAIKDLKIVAVSEDLKSFNRVLELSERFPNVVPCAGFHPWSLKDHDISEAWDLLRFATRHGIRCLGEVGLDRHFMPIDTMQSQVKVLRAYAEAAKELDALLNLHSPDAWRDALSIAVEIGVPKVMFHWYSGPLNLIPEITGRGYFVSINVALKVQPKLKDVAKATPIDFMVFESDGPYNYHGLRLTPLMIPDLAKEVANLKSVQLEELLNAVEANSSRLLNT